jgi:hypothetical protein
MKNYILFLFLLVSGSNVFCQNKLRSIDELTNDTSAWPLLLKSIAEAKNKVEILPVIKGQDKDAIYHTQVTTHSYMGAVVYFTGGILIDGGWIRILGSGSAKMKRNLPDWNKGKSFKEFGEQPPFLLIADDAIGGFFAINGGAFGNDMGQIYYLAPDRLKWEAQHITYSEFLNFCFVGDMNQYYDGLRWKSWENDLKKLNADQSFNFYPFLWTEEGKDINSIKRTIVPVQEQYDFETESIKKLKK